jgi:type II secretory pathway pseudopilin PulG
MHEGTRVEFLDGDDGADDQADLAWPGEEGLASHHRVLLPANTTVHRVVGSLAVLALGFSLTGFLGRSAYRHDQQAAAAAGVLALRAADGGSGATPTIPGSVGGAGIWQVDPTAAVSVDVTNKGPDAITLLAGATLTGQGLIHPAVLDPSGSALLRPGQSGRLTGRVTVACGVGVQNRSAQGDASPGAPQPPSQQTPPQTPQSVLIHARTASGAVAATSVPIGSYAEAVRDQICQEQGDAVAMVFPQSVDAAHHSVTFTISASSRSAQALDYSVLAGYTAGGETSPGSFSPDTTVTLANGEPLLERLSVASVDALLPDARLTDVSASGSTSGTLAPGSSVSAAFTVHVASCPSQAPTPTAASLQFLAYLGDLGQPAYFQAYDVELGSLVATACGLAD